MADSRDPWRLDAQIREAERAGRAAIAATRGGEGSPHALAATRAVSTRSLYLELAERGDDDLSRAFAEWVRYLTLRRVTFPDVARLAGRWSAPVIHDDALEPPHFSARHALSGLLTAEQPGLRRLWARALEAGAGPAAEAAAILAERRAEAAQQLGAKSADLLVFPLVSPETAAEVARALLSATAPLVQPIERWSDALYLALGRDAHRGWPARLSSRWLEGLFRSTGLVDGLSLDIGPLPAALGATSFARALARFGDAYARADVPRAAPFVLARRPVDLRCARRAALFASLIADPVFCARALGLGPVDAADQARASARALVVSLRLDAARLLARCSPGSASQRASAWEEATELALGAPIPAALAGLVPRSHEAEIARLCGSLLALTDRRALIERYDSDWFRSPHAAEAIRHEQSTLAPVGELPAAALLGAVGELSTALGSLG